MKKVASKNRMMFLGGVTSGAAIVGVIAIFIFSIVVVGGIFFVAPQAHAYAVGATTTSITSGANPIGSGYDFSNSLQSLISPFTEFINSLKWNNSTTINTNGAPGATSPTVNLTPVVASTVQNILSQWVSEFDNWFYGVTGVQLSGIMVAILGVITWALGLAQQAVNWLLGLFH
jgi:hypothetical protein